MKEILKKKSCMTVYIAVVVLVCLVIVGYVMSRAKPESVKPETAVNSITETKSVKQKEAEMKEIEKSLETDLDKSHKEMKEAWNNIKLKKSSGGY